MQSDLWRLGTFYSGFVHVNGIYGAMNLKWYALLIERKKQSRTETRQVSKSGVTNDILNLCTHHIKHILLITDPIYPQFTPEASIFFHSLP